MWRYPNITYDFGWLCVIIVCLPKKKIAKGKRAKKEKKMHIGSSKPSRSIKVKNGALYLIVHLLFDGDKSIPYETTPIWGS